MDETLWFGVDIGGSHIEIGAISFENELIKSISIPIDGQTLTPTNAVDIISDSINSLLKDVNLTSSQSHRASLVAGVGVGCPGQSKDGVLLAASNLPLFKNVPLTSMLSEICGGIPVALVNDADAAISAEVWGYKTKLQYAGLRNICMITIGTGIGVGIILGGSLFQGSSNMIEAGHMIVDTSSSARACGCGQKGCVEAYSSAKNTAKRMAEFDSIDTGVEPVVGEAKAVFERAAKGDGRAIEVLDKSAEMLAVLCINLCRVVDPEAIVLAGGMAQAGDALLSLVQEHVKRHTWTVLPTDVKITVARGIEMVGVLGAALAAKSQTTSERMSSTSPSPSLSLSSVCSVNSSSAVGASAVGAAAAPESASSAPAAGEERSASRKSLYSWLTPTNCLLVALGGLAVTVAATDGSSSVYCARQQIAHYGQLVFRQSWVCTGGKNSSGAASTAASRDVVLGQRSLLLPIVAAQVLLLIATKGYYNTM